VDLIGIQLTGFDDHFGFSLRSLDVH
jgi:hypothetical protein